MAGNAKPKGDGNLPVADGELVGVFDKPDTLLSKGFGVSGRRRFFPFPGTSRQMDEPLELILYRESVLSLDLVPRVPDLLTAAPGSSRFAEFLQLVVDVHVSKDDRLARPASTP